MLLEDRDKLLSAGLGFDLLKKRTAKRGAMFAFVTQSPSLGIKQGP
jgi:hypothetical protein